MLGRACLVVATVLLVCGIPRAAMAFGGFVVAKSQGEPTIAAASLVLVHAERRTVLTIAADYEGPAGDVALIVAVPQRVRPNAVRVLEAGVLERLERYTAPRMEEVWEHDPCNVPEPYGIVKTSCFVGGQQFVDDRPISTDRHFVRDGHAITVLSGSTHEPITKWLREHGYVVPELLATVLAHAEPGRHFVVVEFPGIATSAALPPVQVSYERAGLVVPVHIGSVNPSEDPRDLVVHVLAPSHVRPLDHSFASMPTDVVVEESTYGQLDSFYAGLLGLVGEHVAIEFVEELDDSPTITLDDLDTLGLADLGIARRWREHEGYDREIYSTLDTLVLTRMRMRVTEPAADIHLGRHEPQHAAFSARYRLLHPFRGPVECPYPRFGEYETRFTPDAQPSFTEFPERAAADPPWWTYLEYPEDIDSLLVLHAPESQPGSIVAGGGSAHCAVDERMRPPAWLLISLLAWRRRAQHRS